MQSDTVGTSAVISPHISQEFYVRSKFSMFEPSCLSGHSNVMTTAPVRNSGKIVHIGGAEPSVTQALIGEDDGTIGTRKVVF